MPDSPAPLEDLWAGDFGDRYVERNAAAGEGRDAFWKDLLSRHEIATALEVGCNVGGNLAWVAGELGAGNVAGVDVNATALEELRRRVPGVRAEQARGQELPFEDGSFDLVYTVGVLIHVAPADLAAVTSEIVRCSRRYVMCAEYHAETEQEVPYRGETGALFKRDHRAHYESHHSELKLVEERFLTEADGRWDDVTVHLFERS